MEPERSTSGPRKGAVGSGAANERDQKRSGKERTNWAGKFDEVE